MSEGKGLSTRRNRALRNLYLLRAYEDSDAEEDIELSSPRKVGNISSENGIGLSNDASPHVHAHGDAQGRYKAPVERKAERAAKTKSTGSSGSDHVDMPIKSSKDVVKGFKRNLSENRDIVYHFGWFDILIAIGSIFIYIADIVTDTKLAVDYFLQKRLFYGAVTTVLVVGPSLVTCCFGLHWYIIDYRTEKRVISKSKELKGHVIATPGGIWFCRFFFTVLQFGPVVRTSEYLYYGCKSRSKHLTEKEKRRYHWWMLYEDVDNCLLRLFESFIESAPQLCWQLYIFIYTKPSEDIVSTTTRCAALLSSWGSLAISLVSYHKSLRNSRDDKAKLRLISMPFYFLWRASETGGRVLCIAMFASAFSFWVFGILLFHWVVISGWLMNQRTTFYSSKCLEKAFNVICGYVMLFCFLNLREGHTRYRFLVFYIIFYIENFFMLAFWFRFTPDLGAWFHLWGFVSVLVFFVLHIIFQLVFYTFFHPTQAVKYCLPCDSYTFYESVCYDARAGVDDGVGSPSKRYTSREMIESMPEIIVPPDRDAVPELQNPSEIVGRQPNPKLVTYQDRVYDHCSGDRAVKEVRAAVHNLK